MKCFTLFKGKEIHLKEGKKIIPREEIEDLLEGKEIISLAQNEVENFRKEVQEEAEKIREEAKERGFQEGLEKWNEKLAFFENEIARMKADLEKSIVPLAIAAIRKIIGKEIELVPETIVDIVSTAARSVAQHRKITIFVRRSDLEIVEKERPKLKALFENLQSLTLSTRDDIEPGGCIIETEKGIINVSLENQLKALEGAFRTILQKEEKSP